MARDLEDIEVHRKAEEAADAVSALLRKASGKKHISKDELDKFDGVYTVIGKMLSRWIHYLQRSDWKNRG